MKRLSLLFVFILGVHYSFGQCTLDLGVDTVYICQGDSVQFDAGAGWASYSWSNGDTVSTTWEFHSNVVSVQVTDGSGCTTHDTVLVIGVVPNVSASDDFICNNELIDLEAQLYVEYDTLGFLADTLLLPDGGGVNYETTVTVTDFAPGATVEDVFDVLQLCITMEHSYLGDLEMMLTCPTGDTLNIFNSYGSLSPNYLFDGGFNGGGTFLGDPIDQNNLDFGEGWSYCFSDVASWGTFAEEHQQQNFVELDTLLGNNEVGQSMSPGIYKPEWPMEQLMGCPLNGDWTITVRDNLTIDDGYLMFWGIEATSEIDDVSYSWSSSQTTQQIEASPNFSQVYWASMEIGNASCTDSVEIFVNDNQPDITVVPTNAACDSTDGSVVINYSGGNEPFQQYWNGNQIVNLNYGNYQYTLIDSIGCVYEIPVEIGVTPNSWPNLSITILDSECNQANGIASVIANGSDGPYNIEWYGVDPMSLSPGTYPLTITDDNSCVYDTSVTVETDFGPIENIVGETIIFPSQEYIYSVPYSECLNYSWTIDNGTILSGQGTDEVTVTWNDSISGWIAVSIEETRDFSVDLILYVGSATGINEYDSQFTVVPNPITDRFVLNATMTVERLCIVDLTGRTVKDIVPKSGNVEVDLTGLDSGIYNLVVIFEGQRTSQLITKR